MRRGVLIIVCFSLFVISCNSIEETEVDLPDVGQLTFENIDTKLPRININVKINEWDSMIHRPHNKIYTKALFNYSDHSEVVDFPVQLMIKGSASVDYTLKSLEVIFDEEFDNNRYRLFLNAGYNQKVNLDRLKNFRLRNSGQDFTKTMIKDKALTKLAEQSELDLLIMQVGSASQVFINNSYYGLLNMRTESNLNSISFQENVSTDAVVIYKVDMDNGNIEYSEGNFALTPDLEAVIDSGNALEISTMVSESSFIDYVIYQDYIGNIDWPKNNIRMYSINGLPFRFVLYDLDHASEKTKNPLLPELEYISHDLGKMYRAFRKVEGFDERLKKRQTDLYRYWSPALFDAIVVGMSKEIQKDICYQISKHGNPLSVYRWNWEIEKMLRDFEMRDHYIHEKYKFK